MKIFQHNCGREVSKQSTLTYPSMTDKSTSDSVYNETLDKMDDWCEAVLRSILRNLKLDDEETKHSSQTHSICVNASEQRCFQSTEGIWVKSLAQQAAVLNEIQQLLYTQLHLTLRDLFYRQCHIFFCQKESDDIVAYFTRYFQVPRWELYVVSSPRGLVRGQLSFELRGNYFLLVLMVAREKAAKHSLRS